MNEPVWDDFFIAGGTLRANASSYIKRPADDELYNHIKAGEFCYVLTPRQMGKSSLMVSTALRLQNDGFAAVKIDLTKIGTTDIGRWYLGILTQIEKELKLGTMPGKWWKDHEQLSPVQAFLYFLREAVLTKTNKNIVIFIDEIDSTLKYDFRDDFFAGIRSIYNSRAEDPEYNRLTFVLLGVAAPTDLIKDRTRTPFNIGQEISLSNFNREEISIFEAGLEETFPGQSAPILDRIYYWSNGHPYLTQKLCMAIAEHQKGSDEVEIDNFVRRAFLSQEAYRETNLQFVRDMLVKNAQKRQLVSLYARIRKGGKILEDKKSSLQNQLRLSGLVNSQDGYLAVNNKIYHEAFNLEWIKENTEINWPPIIAAIATIIALFFVGTSLYDSVIVPSQIARANDCFYNLSNPPEIRLSCLATMFRKDPFFGIGDNDDRAREKYFSLTSWEDQRSIFQAKNIESQDLIEVIRGLSYGLADVNQGGDRRLLETMQEALVNAKKTPEIDQLQQELDAWLNARLSLERADGVNALDSYNKAIEINPDNPSTLFERGILLSRLGNNAEALQSLDEAVGVSRKSAPTKQQTETPIVTPESLTALPTDPAGSPAGTQALLTPQPIQTPLVPLPTEPPVLLSITSEFYTHTKRVIAIRDFINNRPELLSLFQSSLPDEYPNLRNTSEIAALIRALRLAVSVNSQTYGAADQSITYVFTITNTGTTALGPTQFTISDNKLGAPFNCGPADVTLVPNQSVSCSVDYRITSADMGLVNITNSATASGAGQSSLPATAVVVNLLGRTPLPTGPPMRITFDAGAPVATRIGVINPNETIQYVLNVNPGQNLTIRLTAAPDELGIGVTGPTGLILKPVDAITTWTTAVPAGGDHLITIVNLTASSSRSYTLEVGLTSPSGTATPALTTEVLFSATVNQVDSTIVHPDLACNWAGIGGTVGDANNSPVVGIVVVLRGTLNGSAIEQQTVSGVNKEYGPSGFEFVLGTAPIESNNTLFVQLVDQENIPLSDPVQITTSTDCSKNLVLIRFTRSR